MYTRDRAGQGADGGEGPFTQTPLRDGVTLFSRRMGKFKSSYLVLSFLAPLAKETACMDALILQILRRGCEKYPSMDALSEALEDLFGAYLEPDCRKRGETLSLSFACSFIDSRYAGENLARKMLSLLYEVVFRPLRKGGGFDPQIFESERQVLIERIQAEKSDKRQYARRRLFETMFAGQPFALPETGEIEEVRALTNEAVFARYTRLVAACPLDLYYVGESDITEDALAIFGELAPRGAYENVTLPFAGGGEVKIAHERQKIAQGKLMMGFSCGGATFTSPDFYPLFMANQIFGGSVASKLFMNVREKLSLCYYASSGYLATKGAFFAASGVDFANLGRAEAEIVRQLTDMQEGKITPAEFLSARKGVKNMLLAESDSKIKMAEQMQATRMFGEHPTPLFLERLFEVTLEEVVHAARKIVLDTVFYLVDNETVLP